MNKKLVERLGRVTAQIEDSLCRAQDGLDVFDYTATNVEYVKRQLSYVLNQAQIGIDLIENAQREAAPEKRSEDVILPG